MSLLPTPDLQEGALKFTQKSSYGMAYPSGVQIHLNSYYMDYRP